MFSKTALKPSWSAPLKELVTVGVFITFTGLAGFAMLKRVKVYSSPKPLGLKIFIGCVQPPNPLKVNFPFSSSLHWSNKVDSISIKSCSSPATWPTVNSFDFSQPLESVKVNL